MKSAVIVFPGSNCDRDMQVALRMMTGEEPVMVWHGDAAMPKVDLITVPGGFSYGDYLRAGAMAAHSPVMREVVARAKSGVPVLGVCNGFQVLCEAGLLPGALMRNAGLKFVCRDVHLKVENAQTLFTSRYDVGQVVRIPVAHHDGNYNAAADTLDALEAEGRVAFRYCDASGAATDAANPNGSARNIAGILNEAGNVLGMMPHPERLAEPAHGGTDGRAMFEAMAAAVAA
jgi:phosphoribosylformylglycinamidine synthase I